MNKEPGSPSSYPLGETHFTKYKSTPASLRDPHSGGPTEEQDLASRYRISHPLVSERLTTTAGQPSKDPEGELRWSRNMIVQRSAERNPLGVLGWVDADDINTKLRRDAEEIDHSLDTIKTIDGTLASVQTEQETAKRRHRRGLAEKAFNLVQDMKYLQKRAEWISGHEWYKQKDEPFNPESVVNTHDVISHRILNTKQADGSTLMDMLHEQAIALAKQNDVELNHNKKSD